MHHVGERDSPTMPTSGLDALLVTPSKEQIFLLRLLLLFDELRAKLRCSRIIHFLSHMHMPPTFLRSFRKFDQLLLRTLSFLSDN